jgi:hypothetical protein
VLRPRVRRRAVGAARRPWHRRCRDCAVDYLGPREGVRVPDDRCEVCGDQQRPPAEFFHVLVPLRRRRPCPYGGVVLLVDQCASCRDWLAGALGVEL